MLEMGQYAWVPIKDKKRFNEALSAFDALNAQDPNKAEICGAEDSSSMPKELHDALAMTRWVKALYPEASEAVHLAARCQHLCRWEVPRKTYPAGRTGYLKWRSDLKQRHATRSAEVLHDKGYDSETVAAVRKINLKQDLKNDPEVQQVQDALSLVFLEYQFESYLERWDEAKTTRILQKTWAKMSERAQQAALGLRLSERARATIESAVART